MLLILCLIAGAKSILENNHKEFFASSQKEKKQETTPLIGYTEKDKKKEEQVTDIPKIERKEPENENKITDDTDENATPQPLFDEEEAAKTEEAEAKDGLQEAIDARSALGITADTEIDYLNKHNRWYFNTLSQEEKLVYAEEYETIVQRGGNVYLSTRDEDVVKRVYQAIINDYPEIFYTAGVNCRKCLVGGEIRYFAFTSDYKYTPGEVEDLQRRVEEKAAEAIRDIFNSCGDDPSNYRKVEKTYEWIVNNTSYDLNAENNQNILSVFLGGASVCNGYAKSMQFLLQKMGIECILVSGEGNGVNHAWNMVSVGNGYFHVDPTWGDPSFNKNVGEDIFNCDYSYLGLTDEEIAKDHRLDTTFSVPEATTEMGNYYVQHDLCLASCDEQALLRIFKDAAYQKKDCITFRALSKECYDALNKHLFDEQNIFHYYEESVGNHPGSIRYTTSDKLYTFMFLKSW